MPASPPFVLVVALPAAYYTARHRYRGRLAFLLLVLVTQMFAPTALVIGIYREFVSIGSVFPPAGVNTYVALILVNAAFNLAFATWIMAAYFSTIPVELEEAAAIDGASRLGVLRRVTLPLALPGIVTATIFTFIAAWNEFVVALTLAQSPDIHPLTVGVTTFIGQYRVEWQFLFASSIIAIVPVVVLFIIIERVARRRADRRQHQVGRQQGATRPARRSSRPARHRAQVRPDDVAHRVIAR